jgi:electron transfer flavoprotein alpha subunit
MIITIVKDNCTGCGLCIDMCTSGAIELREGCASIDEEKCFLCKICVPGCPAGAIVIGEEEKKVSVSEGKDTYSGVWIFGEQRQGNLSSVVYELLGIGRELAAY